MKAPIVFCLFALCVSTAWAIIAPKDSYIPPEPKKWVIVPKQIISSSERRFLVKAYLSPREVCGAMKLKQDEIRCYNHWAVIAEESWPLQDNEVEMILDEASGHTTRIRITEELLCAIMEAAPQKMLSGEDLSCHEAWDILIRTQDRQ